MEKTSELTNFESCPQCGGPIECIDSRAQDTYRRRRHRCRQAKCRFSFTTREVRIEEWEKAQEALAIVDKLTQYAGLRAGPSVETTGLRSKPRPIEGRTAYKHRVRGV